MRVKSSPVCAVLAAGLVACSAPTGPKPAEVPRLENAKRVRTVWSVNVGGAHGFAFQPALAGD